MTSTIDVRRMKIDVPTSAMYVDTTVDTVRTGIFNFYFSRSEFSVCQREALRHGPPASAARFSILLLTTLL